MARSVAKCGLAFNNQSANSTTGYSNAPDLRARNNLSRTQSSPRSRPRITRLYSFCLRCSRAAITRAINPSILAACSASVIRPSASIRSKPRMSCSTRMLGSLVCGYVAYGSPVGGVASSAGAASGSASGSASRSGARAIGGPPSSAVSCSRSLALGASGPRSAGPFSSSTGAGAGPGPSSSSCSTTCLVSVAGSTVSRTSMSSPVLFLATSPNRKS